MHCGSGTCGSQLDVEGSDAESLDLLSHILGEEPVMLLYNQEV